MWEVFSLGETPYPGMSNAQAREAVDKGRKREDGRGRGRREWLLL